MKRIAIGFASLFVIIGVAAGVAATQLPAIGDAERDGHFVVDDVSPVKADPCARRRPQRCRAAACM